MLPTETVTPLRSIRLEACRHDVRVIPSRLQQWHFSDTAVVALEHPDGGPVSAPVMVTSASLTMAPEESVTVMLNSPVAVWHNRVVGALSRSSSRIR